MRQFDSGATRDSDEFKIDYDGFLSPRVLRRFGEYMHKHRHQADGKLRASDNWQKGIPTDAYMKSLWRHFMDVWCYHRGLQVQEDAEEALCAMLFNVQGMLHELLKEHEEFESRCHTIDRKGTQAETVTEALGKMQLGTNALRACACTQQHAIAHVPRVGPVCTNCHLPTMEREGS